jgi:hydrogenase maturation protein HypF
VGQFSDRELNVILKMIRGGINTPLTSSAGRLFDGLASLLGLQQVSTFEAEAAMQLQFTAETGSDNRAYEFSTDERGTTTVIDWEPMLREVTDDLRAGVSFDNIAARCHHTLVEMIAAVVASSDSETVALTGGCFQNRLLLDLAAARLRMLGKNVYWHQRIPANDGGIALGQAAALINKLQSELRLCVWRFPVE